MITLLKGKVEEKNEKFIIVDVDGVGYKVVVSSETYSKLPEIRELVKLYTHLHVKEDALDLYGFFTLGELDFFELLLSVSGIGPKAALAIMSVGKIESLKQAIAQEDESFLTKVSGIGKKTAQKLVFSLKSKLENITIKGKPGEINEDSEVIEALTSLGYKSSDIRAELKDISSGVKGVENKVKEILKRIGNR